MALRRRKHRIRGMLPLVYFGLLTNKWNCANKGA